MVLLFIIVLFCGSSMLEVMDSSPIMGFICGIGNPVQSVLSGAVKRSPFPTLSCTV